MHPDVWVLVQRSRLARTDRHVVFDDVRFENEARLIRELGGMIVHLRRPGLVDDDHASECGIGIADNDVVIANDGDVATLRYVLLDCVQARMVTRPRECWRPLHGQG